MLQADDVTREILVHADVDAHVLEQVFVVTVLDLKVYEEVLESHLHKNELELVGCQNAVPNLLKAIVIHDFTAQTKNHLLIDRKAVCTNSIFAHKFCTVDSGFWQHLLIMEMRTGTKEEIILLFRQRKHCNNKLICYFVQYGAGVLREAGKSYKALQDLHYFS